MPKNMFLKHIIARDHLAKTVISQTFDSFYLKLKLRNMQIHINFVEQAASELIAFCRKSFINLNSV